MDKLICTRCGSEPKTVSEVGLALKHFTCDACRKDGNDWDYASRKGGITITIEAMEKQLDGRDNDEPFDIKEEI